MNQKRAFTLIELLVVISVIALLMAILMPVLNKAREQGMRAVCLANLKNLHSAWYMYAMDSDDRLVYTCYNAAANPVDGDGNGKYGWIGSVGGWDDLTLEKRIERLKDGRLWRYLQQPDVYCCPSSERYEAVTYSMIGAMNGWGPRNFPEAVADGLWHKIMSQIYKPAERAVFLDEGYWAWNNDFATFYSTPRWWDTPPIRHNKGVTFALADGHTEYWKWASPETIAYGEIDWRRGGVFGEGNFQPGNPDLERWQKAVWGKLGYEPH